jgi:hypothetical protein
MKMADAATGRPIAFKNMATEVGKNVAGKICNFAS